MSAVRCNVSMVVWHCLWSTRACVPLHVWYSTFPVAGVMQVSALTASEVLFDTAPCGDRPFMSLVVLTAGVPATPGRPLIDFAAELPPLVALAAPAGGYGGPGAKQPQSIKQALEASDRMLAAKEREGNKVSLVPYYWYSAPCCA